MNPLKNTGLTLFTSTIRRGSPDYLDPKLNCHSKLHEVQALVQAIEAGADEALMLDINGFVSTCNSTNFFMIKNGTVITSTDQYCMNGITRQKIIDLCKENNIPVHEKNFSLYDVYDADECFVTGTFAGLSPVISIDGRMIENKSNTKISEFKFLYKKLISDYVRTKVRKIMLWSSPRNISTALMYSFAQRSDTKVLDEPFYAYYLTNVNTKVDHPGKREIIKFSIVKF